MQTETFAPTIKLSDGQTYQPEGWMWILSFALAGCEWAIKEVESSGFQEYFRNSLYERKRQEAKYEIECYENKIAKIKAEHNL